MDNYHEWLAGGDPTNPFSFPPLLTLIPYGASVILTWPTNAFGFTVQSTTNLGSPAVWSTNSPAPIVIGGQNVQVQCKCKCKCKCKVQVHASVSPHY